MIDYLSKSLHSILTQKGLPAELAAAQIVFDHPSEKFNPQQTTVDLFLYDIREDPNLRSNEEIIERRNGKVIAHRPPMRVACSYLVTAWPVGGADLALQEQRLLGQVLQVFARMPVVPDSFLQGSLKGQSPKLPMITALVDPQKNLSEFWTALGSQLRPSLTITVTFSLEVMKDEESAMVTSNEVILGQRTSKDEQETFPDSRERLFRIGGSVKDKADNPISEALVSVVGTSLSVRTDANGRFVISRIAAGDSTLRVVSGNLRRDFPIKVLPPDRQPPDSRQYELTLK